MNNMYISTNGEFKHNLISSPQKVENLAIQKGQHSQNPSYTNFFGKLQ